MKVTRENYNEVILKKKAENRALRARVKELLGFIINNLTNEQAQNEVAIARMTMSAHQDKMRKNGKDIVKIRALYC